MKILSYCNCLKFLCIKSENIVSQKEDIIHKKNIEIIDLKKMINDLNIKIKNLEYELELKNNTKIQYENYSINNEYYRTSEDIEQGYTVFD